MVLLNAGHRDEARAVYREMVAMAPDRLTLYFYAPDGVHVFDSRKMIASLHLALSEVAGVESASCLRALVEVYRKERMDEVRVAIAAAPNYAPARRMLGDLLVNESQIDSFYKRGAKADVGREEAVRVYRRAASLDTGATNAAAQKALHSDWLTGGPRAARQ